MPATRTTTLHDLFAGSFTALTPAAADVDRPRLIRRLKHAAHDMRDDSDPLVAHLRRDGFRESKVLAYAHRPFDTRWLYVDPSADAEYVAHVAAANEFVVGGSFVTRRAAIDDDVIPLYRVGREWQPEQRRFEVTRAPNLSADTREFVRRHGIAETDVFHHAVAMLAAGATSIPLPDHRDAIRRSAVVGYRIATLFADDGPLAALTPHDVALRAFAVPTRTGREARMLRGSALEVSESWRDSEHVETRTFTPDEAAALRDAARHANVPPDEAMALLGNETCDVYLNDRALLRNVPLAAWRYAHRGTPLLRAWIGDRCTATLGRPLLRDEVTHLAHAARRIAALLLMTPEVAANALSCGGLLHAPPPTVSNSSSPAAGGVTRP